MEIYNLYSGSWGSNCYVLISNDAQGRHRAAVVDPSADARVVTDFLSDKAAALDMIILTHGHFDHILSLDTLRDSTGAPAFIHSLDAEMLSDSGKNAYSFFFPDKLTMRNADATFEGGDILKLGEDEIKLIHLPGHSRGSSALLSGNILLTGDTLFDGGVGRCDLYGGNSRELYASIGRLRELDQNLVIYPGHGGSTTLSRALEALF